MAPSFDVTYESVDIEVCAANTFGAGLPASPIRLKLSGYAPAAIMVSSALFYYFFLVPVAFPQSKPDEKDTASIAFLKSWRSGHNLFLFLYSAVCCFSTAAWLFSEGQLFDWHALLCTPVEGTWLRFLSTTFTLSKIVEWVDTAFLVWLGSTPPQFLHKYHHATTFWLFCFVMNMPGPEKFGLLMNGGVHTLMYSHYWRSWPKGLVPIITVLQIAQLATVTYAWAVSPGECMDSSFSGFDVARLLPSTDFILAFLTPYAMVPVFLWLFIVFFVKRFILKKSKGGGASKKSKSKKG